LLLAALVSQTTGCIFVSDDDPEDFATITADWSFRDVNENGVLIAGDLGCPQGFPTIELHTIEVDSQDRPIAGTDSIDLFDCDVGSDFSDPLVPAVYEAFIAVTTRGGGDVYAKSLAEIVDVRIDDKTIDPLIIDNGGYFKVGWTLRKVGTNAALNCSQVTGLNKIEIGATLTGTAGLVDTAFDCERGFDLSDPMPVGMYQVKINPINSANEKIGTGVVLDNQAMLDANRVVDLGTVTLPIP
jgi:hypothetical protein